MKLHRLILRNYRGIAFRDIEFPDHGVVVVSGANEIGKSSMIEALDLLLRAKDRSTKKEVKQVKPTHVDEGAEITAIISTGPYRFEYYKRFHKRPETRLTVSTPAREQLTGDEAHDRVEGILAETVDTELWQAQRVLQSASTASVDLSSCDALARALDVAAGQASTLSGAEPLLIDRIESEFRQYFTATGRPSGQWATAIARLRDATQRVEDCRAAVDEVDDAVLRHAALADGLEQLTSRRATAAARRDAAMQAAAVVARLEERLSAARALAEPAERTREAAEAAVNERRRLRADLTERSATIESLDVSARAAAEELSDAEEAAASAAAVAETARVAVEGCQLRVDTARVTGERIARRAEARRVRARLVKVDAVSAELATVTDELATITLTDAVLVDLERAALAVEKAAAKAELASARIELAVPRQLEVLVDGRPVRLLKGESWSHQVTTAAAVELPGMLTVRVVPGTPAADSQDVLDRARRVLTLLLDEAGAADLDAARALDVRRRELVASRERLRATLDAHLGDESLETLRARAAALDASLADEADDDIDAAAA
ncbi:ATP-binding protein, partial [Mycolicibacterium madagascariense]